MIQMNKKAIAGVVGLGLTIVSPFLLHWTGSFEGTRYKTYLDISGVPTVCEGITGAGVVIGKTYTRAECDALLGSRLEIAGKGVLSCVKVPLNQNQYNAFTDIAYNIGTGAFCRSSAVKAVNLGKYTEGCNRILLWNQVNGKVVQGLVNRRVQEQRLCLTPVLK